MQPTLKETELLVTRIDLPLVNQNRAWLMDLQSMAIVRDELIFAFGLGALTRPAMQRLLTCSYAHLCGWS